MAYVIKQELCSACHRCRTGCPVSAIRFKNAKYWIDPDACISCGACVKVCHNGCISDADAKPKEVEAHDLIEKECDVCVLGAGGAGLVAANKVQDAGLKVIAVEKMHEVGGSSWYAGGFRTHWSKEHAKMGLTDERDAKYEEYMEKCAGHDLNPKLVKRMFSANEKFMDWLIDEHGFLDDYEPFLGKMGPFPETVMFRARKPWEDAAKRIDRMIGPGEVGSYMALHMQDEFLKGGGELLLNTRAKEFLLNDDGSIKGILAADAGGDIRISAKAVIVATGAFSRNKELMDKFQPMFYNNEGKEPIHVFTGAGSTGDGINMCDAIGADIDYVNRRVNMFGPMRHPYPSASMAVYQDMDGFEIGSQGNIYHGDMGHEVSSLTEDPKWHGWKIMDDNICETAINEAMQEPPQSADMDLPAFQKNWREVFAEEAEDNAIVMADTLEELAKKLGIDEAEFLKNVDDYNESTKEPMKLPPGMPDFMKPKHDRIKIEKAPFYAIKMKMFHENSIGGMTIDENASVLKGGEPIPGLYAAGDTTRGIMIPGDVGVEYVESVFTSLTQAYDEGFIAAEEAAAYAKNN